MSVAKAFNCFVGAWGFINATAVNTTTGAIIPEWHGPYPSGMSVYDPSGYNTFIITANDTTEPERRPKTVSLPAKPGDPVQTWATIAQHSLAVGGPFYIVNATDGTDHHDYDRNSNKKNGPSGYVREKSITSTLPAWVGIELLNEFDFYDNCNTHVLRSNPTPGIEQIVWFYRRPDNSKGQVKA
ncbi:uncharacterized protein LTHEOB_855 [Lasiodiplodia theobromae]|uniref:Uncharacterized protein n=1 Tax=Lasiodiplodia theobromae TaxID=45133 RepID=A0A5N5DQB4_9PEZI|nr:uncharacterized protein LTHEOB_855 [Lasiodiplodia theobromae]KAB2579993.1 hypothetical protein DBV05_g1467 [Lasiodiplodia theobromae]KAF4540913.1 hypothetical protein LTHEOB_855 [Lasiodiplodia theobromae]